uniref:DUF4236 domain-containing protein n=1 Tax=Anguilla anguilla TaxID=7936 RepID=A0A0E9XM32_ANGAN
MTYRSRSAYQGLRANRRNGGKSFCGSAKRPLSLTGFPVSLKNVNRLFKFNIITC